jgi:hypothetical protein
MDPATAKILIQIGTYGPLGLMAALGFWLFFLERKRTAEERKRNEELSTKLHELALESIRSDTEHSKAYGPLEKVFDKAIDVLADLNKRKGRLP